MNSEFSASPQIGIHTGQPSNQCRQESAYGLSNDVTLQREPTPKELLAKYIAQCRTELDHLTALYSALPDEMEYRASRALNRIINSSFNK